MISEQEIREMEAAFASLKELNTSAESVSSQDNSAVPISMSDSTNAQVDPIVEVLADILSELQSLNEFIRQ